MQKRLAEMLFNFLGCLFDDLRDVIFNPHLSIKKRSLYVLNFPALYKRAKERALYGFAIGDRVELRHCLAQDFALDKGTVTIIGSPAFTDYIGVLLDDTNKLKWFNPHKIMRAWPHERFINRLYLANWRS